jgi:uncharacterized protein (DUF885 family)
MTESDALAAVKKRMSETAVSLAESAAKLRRAIAEGTVPPKTTDLFATQLEDIAARMGQGEAQPLESGILGTDGRPFE